MATFPEAAAQITVPVEFLLRWDDEIVPRESGLALFGAIGSVEKALHANPGGHTDVPTSEVDSSERRVRGSGGGSGSPGSYRSCGPPARTYCPGGTPGQ